MSTIFMMVSLTVGIDIKATIKRECHDWPTRVTFSSQSKFKILVTQNLTATTEATSTWQKALHYFMDETIIEQRLDGLRRVPSCVVYSISLRIHVLPGCFWYIPVVLMLRDNTHE